MSRKQFKEEKNCSESLFREWLNYKKALHMVTIREYKEFCARKIIVTASQKHLSQPKIKLPRYFIFLQFMQEI